MDTIIEVEQPKRKVNITKLRNVIRNLKERKTELLEMTDKEKLEFWKLEIDDVKNQIANAKEALEIYGYKED